MLKADRSLHIEEHLTSSEELEFDKLLGIPASAWHRLIPHSSKRSAFGEPEDPDQVHRDIDGNNDEDEEMLHPPGGSDAMQSDGERGLARRRGNNAKGRNQDGEEVDRLEIIGADCVNMLTEAEGDQVGVDGCSYSQRHLQYR